jgi:hypothetical protein
MSVEIQALVCRPDGFVYPFEKMKITDREGETKRTKQPFSPITWQVVSEFYRPFDRLKFGVYGGLLTSYDAFVYQLAAYTGAGMYVWMFWIYTLAFLPIALAIGVWKFRGRMIPTVFGREGNQEPIPLDADTYTIYDANEESEAGRALFMRAWAEGQADGQRTSLTSSFASNAAAWAILGCLALTSVITLFGLLQAKGWI